MESLIDHGITADMQIMMEHMSKKYKKRHMEGGEITWQGVGDLKEYIQGQMNSEKAQVFGAPKISVGTDSKFHPRGRRAWAVSYVTIIAFTFGNRGTHLICRRERKMGDGRLSLFDRLWEEVQMSVHLALWIRHALGIEVEVHFDVNPKESAGSNIVHSAAVGYGEAFGFKVESKPDSPIASAAADHFVRNKD